MCTKNMWLAVGSFGIISGLALFAAKAFPFPKAQQTAAEAPQTEEITIDTTAEARPFPHFWERMFGSGRANLSMRADYRRDLALVQGVTQFKYVRFHAILDDENGVYQETGGKPVYNFSYVDQIYDGLLLYRVRPYVEISFMPRALAANPKPHPFWYKPIPSPPNSYAKWDALMETFTRHLIDRYGAPEVEQWYFEVWNEPNIDFWDGVPKQQTYFTFYDETARTIKKVDAKLRVGGPATAQAAWIPAFISHCTQNHVPFDFVSTHVYGNDTAQDVFGTNEKISRKDMVGRAVKKVYDEVKHSPAPDTPIIWSEYNASYMNEIDVTDSAFMGPWLANNIRECDGLQSMMSYWTFSDVFEEQGVVKTPFYGGYGLIAERSIPKAAFHAFELLHHLADRRLPVNSDDALVTEQGARIAIALWNYAGPGEKGVPKTFKLHVTGGNASAYRIQMVGPDNGSGLSAWRKMGSPVSPTMAQIEQLRHEAAMLPATSETIDTPITLQPHTLALVELR